VEINEGTSEEVYPWMKKRPALCCPEVSGQAGGDDRKTVRAGEEAAGDERKTVQAGESRSPGSKDDSGNRK